jgi:hypothetical protein
MAPADDKAAAAAADKAKDAGKPKAAAGAPRQLNRQELEFLRKQLQTKFHHK